MRASWISPGWLTPLVALVCIGAAGPDARLVDAVKHGDRATVRALLQKHVDVNAPEPDGTTALHWAASRDDVETVKLLVRAGANAKMANRYGVTPLLLACETGGAATAEALLDAGADPNSALPEGETGLMIAARSGKAELVRLLAAHGAKVDAKESWHGQTAVMWAAGEDHGEVVKALAELGANIKARTEGGFTPFLFAVRAGKINAARALLDLGVDVNDALQPSGKAIAGASMPPANGNNAGANAANNTLRPSGNGEGTSALILAITNKRWELAKFLVEHGADPNDTRVGWTPLHELAYIRRPNIGKGLPPQEDVEHIDTLEVARVLIEHGANVNARQTKERRDGLRNELNRIGATPLILAAKHADVPYMQFLAAHGADPKATTAEHASVLMVAAGVGIFNVGESAGTNAEAFEATKLAYELGSTDVNATDNNGWTALHGAAKRGSTDIVQFLVDRGYTAFELKTKTEAWTPLRIADGVFVGATIKRSDETAALIRKLMVDRGLQPPAKIANDVGFAAPAQRPDR